MNTAQKKITQNNIAFQRVHRSGIPSASSNFSRHRHRVHLLNNREVILMDAFRFMLRSFSNKEKVQLAWNALPSLFHFESKIEKLIVAKSVASLLEILKMNISGRLTLVQTHCLCEMFKGTKAKLMSQISPRSVSMIWRFSIDIAFQQSISFNSSISCESEQQLFDEETRNNNLINLYQTEFDFDNRNVAAHGK